MKSIKNLSKLLISLYLVLLFVDAYPQNADSIITIEKRKLFLNGQELNSDQIKMTLGSNVHSAQEYNLSKKNAIIGSSIVLAGSGLALTGSIVALSSSIKQANALNDGYYTEGNSGLGLALAGLGLAVVSLPFTISAKKHLKKSIDLYNSDIQKIQSNSPDPLKFDLMTNANGIAVKITF